MSSPPTVHQPRTKLGALPFVIAGLSFIPLAGVPFGIAAIVWGGVAKKTGRLKLALIGAGGIATTIALYGGLIFFGFMVRGGVYDPLRAELARSQLYILVQGVEFYRLQYGGYPDTLKQLQATLPTQSLVMVFDPSEFRLSGSQRYFYYQRVGIDHYYLRGVGPDGEPFTADDILPEVKIAPNSRIGLLLDAPPAQPAQSR